MILIGIALAVCIVGLLLYLLAAPPKLQEVGRIMFFVGLWFVVQAVSHTWGASEITVSHR